MENHGVLTEKLTDASRKIDHVETDTNQKLDKIFNKIASLDNDVNKKDYVINDDRMEIIKNLLKMNAPNILY